MRYFKSFLFLLISCPLFSVAQANYQPGYVVDMKGDTIRGYIDYSEWGQNPNTIHFKAAITDSKSRSFSTDDITFFSVDKLEDYQRYSGRISMDVTDANHVSEGRDSSFKVAAVFLKVLQKGRNVSLYSYTDDIKTRFYIKESTDQLPEELVYRIYIDDGKTVNENTYLKRIMALSQKYNALTDSFQQDIDHSDYVRQDIIKLISEINGISKDEYQKRYNSKTKLQLFAGIALNMAGTNPIGPYLAIGGKAYSSYLPAASFGVNLLANPNTGKLVFRVEIAISENQYKSIYIYTGSPYVPVRYSYNQLWIAGEPQVIYNFYNTDKFKVYAGIGLAITSYKYYNGTFDLNYADTKSTNNPITSKSLFYNFNTPVLFKAGVEINKKIGVFADYITNAPVTHDLYFTLNSHSTQIGLYYVFE